MRRAFPSSLAAELPALEACLSVPEPREGASPWRVQLDGEPLVIPYRIYTDARVLETVGTLSERPQRMAHCLFTRHHDGYVRERCLRELLGAPERWVVPYVALLLGEYVLELHALVAQRAEGLDAPAYRAFFAENPVLYGRTRARAVSYWNCYYRQRYPDRRLYPALRLLERFAPTGS